MSCCANQHVRTPISSWVLKRDPEQLGNDCPNKHAFLEHCGETLELIFPLLRFLGRSELGTIVMFNSWSFENEIQELQRPGSPSLLAREHAWLLCPFKNGGSGRDHLRIQNARCGMIHATSSILDSQMVSTRPPGHRYHPCSILAKCHMPQPAMALCLNHCL